MLRLVTPERSIKVNEVGECFCSAFAMALNCYMYATEIKWLLNCR